MENTNSNYRFMRPRRDPELMPAITDNTHGMVTRRRIQTNSPILRERTRVRVVPYNRQLRGGAERSSETSGNTTRRADAPSSQRSMCPGSPILPCSICFCDMHPRFHKSLSVLHCGHAFCTPCIKNWIESKGNCPKCRQKQRLNSIKPLFI